MSESPMANVILSAETNSNQLTPEYASFDEVELQAIISQYAKVIDWSNEKSILCVSVSTLPDCEFCDEQGDLITQDEADNLAKWEQNVTDVSATGLSVIFSHSEDGTELFFEYNLPSKRT